MTDTEKSMLATLHDNPLDVEFRLVFADYCEENGGDWLAEELRKGRIPLATRQERLAVEVLKSCNFAPATWDKKFARDLPSDAISLTPRQYLWLWILLRKYRRSNTHDAIKAEAEKRYQRYQELHKAEMVKPVEKPLPKTKTAQSARKAKASRMVKSAEMPLFD